MSEKALRASTQFCTTYLLLLYLLTYHGTVDDAHELLGDGWVQRHDDDGVAWFGFVLLLRLAVHCFASIQ